LPNTEDGAETLHPDSTRRARRQKFPKVSIGETAALRPAALNLAAEPPARSARLLEFCIHRARIRPGSRGVEKRSHQSQSAIHGDSTNQQSCQAVHMRRLSH
jgi:hypothetical protein